jgi:hypothetical protein
MAARSRDLEPGTLIHLICMATLYLRVSPIILNECRVRLEAEWRVKSPKLKVESEGLG